LTINNKSSNSIQITACNSYTTPSGKVWTSSKIENDTIPNAVGCDSIITIDLTINKKSTHNIQVIACDRYTTPSGKVWTTSRTENDTITNAVGCDSIITIDLTINNKSSNSIQITACNSYTTPSGKVWITSKTENDTIPNAVGCDSIITIDLTINKTSYSTDVITTCESYTWIDGNTYTESNFTATHTLSNISGCDSIVTLNLTINKPNTGIDAITTCDSYTWIDGNTYTESNFTATHTLTNISGCDSIITLNLTINKPSTGIDAITTCDSYTWIDGNTYSESNFSATHTLTNKNGCDSIVSLNLIINKSSHHTIDTVICKREYTSPSGNILSNTGSYTEYLTNHQGCDSIVYINLLIEDISNCGVYMDEVFTPNDDGENDVWIIHNYDPIDYPNSRIQIFNRLGAMVLDESPYQNNWNGTFGKSEKKAAIGTYFYLLDLGDGSEPIKGFIYLNR